MSRARAGEVERRALGELFAELCAIESPFGQERACADRVAAELRALGLAVAEDDVGPRVGAGAGNLLARIEPRTPDAPSVLLCAHLDTVPLTAPVAPELVDGVWQNANDGILGADNKAAVAVVLAAARRFAAEPPPVGVELLFTVCEEDALAGAKAFDVGRLRSACGFVFDHATPIGELIVASPTYHRVRAEFRGVEAHAGIRPEDGRSAIAAAAAAVAAMRLGRLDPETTANVGLLHGGSGINVVPGACRLEAEARSLDAEKAAAVVAELTDHLHDGANAAECDVDVMSERRFRGYRLRRSAPQVAAAEAALRACGHTPRHVESGGGSDANALIAAGLPCVNVANGTARAHQPDESVPATALDEMLDVVLALVPEAGRALC